MTALIRFAEDKSRICAPLDAYLKCKSFCTFRAGDGRAALDLHLSLKPSHVFLDVTMLPLLDGWEMLTEIRHRGDTPAILITALDQDIQTQRLTPSNRTASHWRMPVACAFSTISDKDFKA